MERIEITPTDTNLFDIIKQVSQNRISVELTEGQVPVARIVPVDSGNTMAALDRAMRDSARLGDDAEAFAEDVLSIRQSLGELDDPWDS